MTAARAGAGRGQRVIESDVDLVGELFRLAEQAGSRVDFGIGKIRRGRAEPDWAVYSHARHDGLGGLMDALGREGYRIEGFPQFKGPPPPSALGMRLAVLRGVWASRRSYRDPWRAFGTRSGGALADCQAWFAFSRAQTTRIREHAKAQGVTLGAWLLWAMDRSVPGSLVRDPTAPRSWTMPINMRGPLRLPSEYMNLSLSIDVRVRPGMSPHDVHRRMLRDLRANKQWARWHWTWRFETAERLRKFYAERPEFRQPFRTGAFGNLGELPLHYVAPTPESAAREPIEAVIIAPVVGLAHPIAGTAFTWDGRLTLALRFDDRLVADLERTKELLALWVEEALGPVEPVSASAIRDAVGGERWESIYRRARTSPSLGG